MTLEIIKSKEAKRIIKIIENQWGAETKLNTQDYVFLINNKNKIYFAKREVFEHDLKPFSVGIYLGTLIKESFRLSIEGAQIIGPSAKKNVLELKDEDMVKTWMKGEDIEIKNIPEKVEETFVILKYNNDFLGCGKYKEDYVFNYVNKARRIDMI